MLLCEASNALLMRMWRVWYVALYNYIICHGIFRLAFFIAYESMSHAHSLSSKWCRLIFGVEIGRNIHAYIISSSYLPHAMTMVFSYLHNRLAAAFLLESEKLR